MDNEIMNRVLRTKCFVVRTFGIPFFILKIVLMQHERSEKLDNIAAGFRKFTELELS